MKQYPSIKIFEPDLWELKSAALLHIKVKSIIRRRGCCNILLTGGTAAERVYSYWSSKFDIYGLRHVNFFLGDERCVPLSHHESNFGMIIKTLFHRGIPQDCCVHPIETQDGNFEGSAKRYAEELPESVDILLLGVGQDGHIASIFPNSKAIREKNKKVLPILGPKPPLERITITPLVISQANTIIVLAPGAEKASILEKALKEPENIEVLPARLVLRGIWLLDMPVKANDRNDIDLNVKCQKL